MADDNGFKLFVIPSLRDGRTGLMITSTNRAWKNYGTWGPGQPVKEPAPLLTFLGTCPLIRGTYSSYAANRQDVYLSQDDIL